MAYSFDQWKSSSESGDSASYDTLNGWDRTTSSTLCQANNGSRARGKQPQAYRHAAVEDLKKAKIDTKTWQTLDYLFVCISFRIIVSNGGIAFLAVNRKLTN